MSGDPTTVMDADGQYVDVSEVAREEGRKAVASFCGLLLRRTQEWEEVVNPNANLKVFLTVADFKAVIGEALQQFTDREDEKRDAESE